MSLLFNGTTQNLRIGAGRPWCANVAGGTLMCWLRIIPANTGAIACVGFFGGTGLTRAKLTINGPTRTIELRGRSLDSDGSTFITSTTTLNVSQLYHLAGVFSFATATGFIYINGALDFTGRFTLMSAGNTSNTNSTGGSIAAQESGSPNFFPGYLEDVRIYNRALGPAEIATIYASQSSDGIVTGLQARWPCIGGATGTSPTVVADVSSNGYGATPTASPTFQANLLASKYRFRNRPGTRIITR